MVFAYPPVGQTVVIRNLLEKEVTGLYYVFEGFPDTNIKKIAANEAEQFLIITSHLHNDLDLTFYFKENPDIRFVFKNAVRAFDSKQPYSYFFGKIIEEDGILTLENDPDGKTLYFQSE